MSGTACNQRPGSVWSRPDVVFKGELNEKGFLSCWLVDSISTKTALFFVSVVLQDVRNLVWKLDLFLHSGGNERLLDSYNAERLPVIKGVIETTDFLTKIMATPNKFPQALRDAVMPLISRVTPFHNALVRKLSELGIAYKGSPIVEGPGEEYFDDSMRGGKGIRSRFLVLVDDKEVPAKEAAKHLRDSLATSLSCG